MRVHISHLVVWLVYFLLYLIGMALLSFLPRFDAAVLVFVLLSTFIWLFHHRIFTAIHNLINRSSVNLLRRLEKGIDTLDQLLQEKESSSGNFKQLYDALDEVFGEDNYRFLIRKGNVLQQIDEGHHADYPVVSLEKECDRIGYSIRVYSAREWEQGGRDCPVTKEILLHFPDYPWIIPLVLGKQWRGIFLLHKCFTPLMAYPPAIRVLDQMAYKLALIVERFQVQSESDRKALQTQLLLDIAKKISSTLNYHEVLDLIVDSAARLVSYDAAAIFIVDREKKILRHTVTRGYDKRILEKMPLKLHQGISGEVVKTGRASIVPQVKKDPHYFAARRQTRSQLTIPLYVGEEVIGAMVFESDQENHFTEADLELLTTFASMAAIAIANAQLYQEALKKRKLEGELLIASSIQKALLPQRPPAFPGIQMEILSKPSLIVGGDLYDVFRFKGNSLGVMIGDVSGKGAAGAILMALVYAGFRSLLKEIWEVSEIIARLNNFLVETTSPGYFTTFFFALLNPENQTITYCNAGHNPPILLRKDGKAEWLTEGGTVLGFLPDQAYVQRTISLNPGDYLILYTDGITEVKNRKGQEFGEKRLLQFIRRLQGKTPREMKKEIYQHIRHFVGRDVFPDDLTLIILRYTPQSLAT